MIEAFDENRETASEQFPFDDIYSRLDHDTESIREEAMRLAALGLRYALEWVGEPLKCTTASEEEKLRMIALRFLSALWTVSPDLVGGISAAKLGKSLGFHRAAVSERASEFTRRFGIRNAAQQHGRNGAHVATLKPMPVCDKPPDSAMRKELDRAAKLGEYQEVNRSA